MTCDLSTLPSKPRVGGSNPSERADSPAEVGPPRSSEIPSSPHVVPIGGDAKLPGRSAFTLKAIKSDLLAGFSPAELNGISARLDSGSVVDPASGCWLWTRALDRDGYGRLSVRGRRRRIHRLRFEIAIHPIPPGMMVCHHCDVRHCANPSHLFVGTAQDNVSDMMAKGRGNRRTQTGEKNGRAKLTADQVRWILGSKLSVAEMSRRLSRPYMTVADVAHRRTWKRDAALASTPEAP